MVSLVSVSGLQKSETIPPPSPTNSVIPISSVTALLLMVDCVMEVVPPSSSTPPAPSVTWLELMSACETLIDPPKMANPPPP